MINRINPSPMPPWDKAIANCANLAQLIVV